MTWWTFHPPHAETVEWCWSGCRYWFFTLDLCLSWLPLSLYLNLTLTLVTVEVQSRAGLGPGLGAGSGLRAGCVPCGFWLGVFQD